MFSVVRRRREKESRQTDKQTGGRIDRETDTEGQQGGGRGGVRERDMEGEGGWADLAGADAR